MAVPPPDTRKAAAVDVWSDVPCGLGAAGARTGDAAHVERVLAEAEARSPWMAGVLDERRAAGLDILDVGCGPGIQLVRLARRGARVTGIDLVPVHVEQARANLAAVGLTGEASVGDAEDLAFADSSFDRVLSVNALQFTPGFDRAVAELYRVLRPGGDATVVVYHRGSAWYWWHFVALRGLLGG